MSAAIAPQAYQQPLPFQQSAPAPEVTPSASTRAAPSASRVTELVIPGGDQNAVLLPMVRFLSEQNQQQWLTLISHHNQEPRWLKNQGLNPRTLRVIQANSHKDILWMTWEALTNGTSHTVVAELSAQPKDVIKELERAAAQGNCRLILVQNRQHS